MKISAEKTINIDLAFTSEEALSLRKVLNILEDFQAFIHQELYEQYELKDFVEPIYGNFTDFIEELIYRPTSVETELADFIEKKGKEIAF
jgi:hypothetical protein